MFLFFFAKRNLYLTNCLKLNFVKVRLSFDLPLIENNSILFNPITRQNINIYLNHAWIPCCLDLRGLSYSNSKCNPILSSYALFIIINITASVRSLINHKNKQKCMLFKSSQYNSCTEYKRRKWLWRNKTHNCVDCWNVQKINKHPCIFSKLHLNYVHTW